MNPGTQKAAALALSFLISVPFPASAAFEPGASLNASFDGSEGEQGFGIQPQGEKGFQILKTPEIPDSDWKTADPDGGLDESNPGAPDRVEFWDKLQARAFDQICRNIKLKVGQGFDLGEYAGAHIEAKRSMERYANGQFALIDEAGLDLSAGLSENLVDIGETANVFVRFGTTLSGRSLVVRPLEGKKSCKLLKNLVDIREYKTVLPLNAKRIKAMEVGELWKLPLRLRVDIGAGVGTVLSELPASIYLGRADEDRAAATLYRVAADAVRFRMRLDSAVLYDASAQLTYNFADIPFGLPAAQNAFLKAGAKLIDKVVARELDKYISARLGLSHHRADGRQVMVEFVLDPNRDDQMEALNKVLHGDLNVLGMMIKMAQRAKKALAGDRKAREEMEEIVRDHEERLGLEKTFAGADDYGRRHSRFFFMLPFLWDYDRNKGTNTDQVVLLDDAGGEYDIHRSYKGSENAFLDIPFLGQITKNNYRKSAQVSTYKNAEGHQSDPIAVYHQQEGFLRRSEYVSRRMVQDAHEIATLVGVKGEGRNKRLALPVEDLFPKPGKRKCVHRMRGQCERWDNTDAAKNHKRGVMSFTLAFSMKAVRDIVYAPADIVLKSYANSLAADEAAKLTALLKHATIGKDGELEYDRGKVLRELGHTSFFDEDAKEDRQDLYWIAGRASNILKDLASARDAKTPEDRSAALLNILSGKGESGLAYDDILKVLVQLVDPLDVSAEFYVRVDKDQKGQEDVDARYTYNKGGADADLLAGVSKTISRFQEPSVLAD